MSEGAQKALEQALNAGAAAGLDAAYRALIYAGEFDAAYCVASDAMASGQMPAPMRGQINDALYALEAAGGVAGITLPVDLDWIRYVASIADHGYASTLPTRQRIHCYPERWQAITALARGHWAEGMTDAGSNEPKREPPIEIKQWGALWYAQRGRERTMNFLFRQELEQALHTGKAWERACALPLQPTPQHPCLPTEPDAPHPPDRESEPDAPPPVTEAEAWQWVRGGTSGWRVVIGGYSTRPYITPQAAVNAACAGEWAPSREEPMNRKQPPPRKQAIATAQRRIGNPSMMPCLSTSGDGTDKD